MPSTTQPHQELRADGTVDRHDLEARHAHQRRVFHVHATVFATAMLLMFVTNLATNLAAGVAGDWSAWWSVWALIGWGWGLAVHALAVHLAAPQPLRVPGTRS